MFARWDDVAARAIQVREPYDKTMQDQLWRAGEPQHNVAATRLMTERGNCSRLRIRPETYLERIEFIA